MYTTRSLPLQGVEWEHLHFLSSGGGGGRGYLTSQGGGDEYKHNALTFRGGAGGDGGKHNEPCF